MSATSDPLNMVSSKLGARPSGNDSLDGAKHQQRLWFRSKPRGALRPPQNPSRLASGPEHDKDWPALVAATFRTLLLLAVGVAASLPALAADLPEADRTAALNGIASARSGDWPKAYAAVAHTADPLPLKIVRWLDYTRSSVAGRFADVSGFIDQNPDWPGQRILRRQAETALSSESDDG